jgi:Bacterial capsule synthesis protein PGA_cap
MDLSTRQILAATALLAILATISCGSVEPAAPLVRSLEKKTDGPVTVLVGGDTMLGDLALPFIKKYGYDYPFEGVLPLLQNSDLVNVNLEAPIAKECQFAPIHEFPLYFLPRPIAEFAEKLKLPAAKLVKPFSYFTYPESAHALSRAGITAVSLANNHILDCGIAGMKETYEHLAEAGIDSYGSGFDREQRHRGLVYDIEGTRVGFVGWYSGISKGSLLDWKGGFPEWGAVGTAHYTEDAIRRDIAVVSEEADVVIVTFHWGSNYKTRVTKSQRGLARIAVEAGADAVIGHHAHVPQGVEIINGKPVIYSAGNFVFGTGNNKAVYGQAARFSIENKAISKLELIPLFVQNRNKDVRWQAKIATEGRAKGAARRLQRLCDEFGTEISFEQDIAVIRF